jgi:hypothetical protein
LARQNFQVVTVEPLQRQRLVKAVPGAVLRLTITPLGGQADQVERRLTAVVVAAEAPGVMDQQPHL